MSLVQLLLLTWVSELGGKQFQNQLAQFPPSSSPAAYNCILQLLQVSIAYVPCGAVKKLQKE